MLFVLNEGICNHFHSINRADGDDGRSSTYDQAELSRVIGYLTGIIGIYNKWDICLLFRSFLIQ